MRYVFIVLERMGIMSKILNQLIRKEIDKSAKLRNLIKDSEMSKQMS